MPTQTAYTNSQFARRTAADVIVCAQAQSHNRTYFINCDQCAGVLRPILRVHLHCMIVPVSDSFMSYAFRCQLTKHGHTYTLYYARESNIYFL